MRGRQFKRYTAEAAAEIFADSDSELSDLDSESDGEASSVENCWINCTET